MSQEISSRDVYTLLGKVLAVAISVLASLCVLEVSCRMYFNYRDNLDSIRFTEHRKAMRTVCGVCADARNELGLLRTKWMPNDDVTYLPFQGRYLTINEDGTRATWDQHTGNDPVRILFLGDSEVFGFYARDEFTLPSQVAKLLEARGYNVQVSNAAMGGAISMTMAVRFMRYLKSHPRPDIVVLPGLSIDLVAGAARGAVDVTERGVFLTQNGDLLTGKYGKGTVIAWLKGLYLARAVQSLAASWTAWSGATGHDQPVSRELMRKVGVNYCANIGYIRAIADSLGIGYAGFVFPELGNKAHKSDFEQDILQRFTFTSEAETAQRDNVIDGLKERLKALGIDDLRHGILDADNATIFMDQFHTNERGYELLAVPVAARLAGEIDQRLSASGRKRGGHGPVGK